MVFHVSSFMPKRQPQDKSACKIKYMIESVAMLHKSTSFPMLTNILLQMKDASNLGY